MSKTRVETFRLRFVGAAIRPESLPLRRLANALDAVQRLVAPAVHDAIVEGESTDEGSQSAAESAIPLHLMDVLRGSAVYPVFAEESEEVMQRLRLIGRVEEKPQLLAPYRSSVSALEDLATLARSLSCEIEFREPGAKGAVIATVTPQSFANLRGALYITGPTSLVATVERAGGKTDRHCGLRIPQQPRKQLVCKVVSDELVRRLGESLYQTVTVHGTATWYRHDWWITDFTIQDMESHEPTSPLALLDEMRNIGGKAWSEIADPEAFVKELRG